ncbi:MAG: TrkH family potassium uptake protein [Alphaproteobacteria bacterium]
MNFKPVALSVGSLLTVLSLFMAIPALIDLYDGDKEWTAFLISATVTAMVGVMLILTTNGQQHKMTMREAFLMVNLAWLSIALFGALPFIFSSVSLPVVDAVFESMSGITTTGSTVMSGLDDAPRGILMWRSMLQWLGGIGIVVMALSILPMLQVGGMQLFKVEAFDQSEKILPRATEIAVAVTLLYTVMTLFAWVALYSVGMPSFDAMAHAMTAIATGGFSTSDASIGHFNNSSVEWITILLMIIGSLPFVFFLRLIRGDGQAFLSDSQIRVFFVILFVFIALTTAWLVEKGLYSIPDAIRYATFNITSIMTGTGFASADYMLWGSFPITIFFIVMFIGGCAGSTTCGIKIFRIQILFTTARMQLQRLIQPHGVFLSHYNRRAITEEVTGAVMGYFFLFIGIFALIAIMLGLTGLDFMTTITAAATSIANVGPGLGDVIGPAGNFHSLEANAKIIMILGMLLGRLELFTVLVLFVPSFWKN